MRLELGGYWPRKHRCPFEGGETASIPLPPATHRQQEWGPSEEDRGGQKARGRKKEKRAGGLGSLNGEVMSYCRKPKASCQPHFSPTSGLDNTHMRTHTHTHPTVISASQGPAVWPHQGSSSLRSDELAVSPWRVTGLPSTWGPA